MYGASVVGGGARDDVPVGVWDFLTGCGAVIDGDGGCGGVCGGFDGGDDMMDGGHEVLGKGGWEVIEAFVMLGGDHECVAGREGVCVEECVGCVGLVYGAAGSLVGSDLTEHARHGRLYGNAGGY